MNDVAVYVRKTEIAPAETKRQTAMINAQQVEHRGMQVMDMHRMVFSKISKGIGRSIDGALPHPCSGHPHREAVRMVVTAVCFSGALRDRGAAEFTSPNHQGIVE